MRSLKDQSVSAVNKDRVYELKREINGKEEIVKTGTWQECADLSRNIRQEVQAKIETETYSLVRDDGNAWFLFMFDTPRWQETEPEHNVPLIVELLDGTLKVAKYHTCVDLDVNELSEFNCYRDLTDGLIIFDSLIKRWIYQSAIK